MNKFKKGDKVKIPTCESDAYKERKTKDTSAVLGAKGKNQPYVYVYDYSTDYKKVIVGCVENSPESTFLESDLELYQEQYTPEQILKELIAVKLDTEEEWRKITNAVGKENSTYRFFGNSIDCYYRFGEKNVPEVYNKSGYGEKEWYVKKGFKIIDFSQINFEEMDKKIIGYKAPIDMFGGTVEKGTLFVKPNIEAFWYSPKGNTGQSIACEIVETWEPVYEEAFKIGNYVYIKEN